MTAIIGPLETLRQARDVPAVRATYDAAHASPRRGVLGERNAAMLDEACRAAGIRRGAWDYRILAWLAGWEPETCVVVAGLIQRAHQAGRDAANADHARQAASPRSCLWCGATPAPYVQMGDPFCESCYQDAKEE